MNTMLSPDMVKWYEVYGAYIKAEKDLAFKMVRGSVSIQEILDEKVKMGVMLTNLLEACDKVACNHFMAKIEEEIEADRVGRQ
jgi:hypothetical protein